MHTPNTHPDWTEGFARLGPKLLLFARQWLLNQADAEDAVQEAFVRFWRKRGSLADGNQGLLFAAVRSAALDFLRREVRRSRREQAAHGESEWMAGGSFFEPVFPGAGSFGGLPPLEAAVRALPAEQREVLVLKIWGDLTFAEVATALAISPNTAASRYRYALAHLKRTLQPACHE